MHYQPFRTWQGFQPIPNKASQVNAGGRKPLGGSPGDTVNTYDTTKGKQNMKRIGQGKKEYTVLRQYDAESEPIRTLPLTIKQACHAALEFERKGYAVVKLERIEKNVHA